ncbi:MAG: transcription-repair coupling factor [Candidatus Eisenbacteria bacterium]|uniref:Transcription-repair-coupling factor n=1 Tax=Eiseniibacteriota bacterium TaxID=2212470 RepID=A0A538UBU1_UNCEI|nr:MAG: transcription-repair coupling factor [Candidatus Eisenbacteria bacterium]
MQDTWLKDSLAEALLDQAGELPEAFALLEAARRERPGKVRGLTGSARALLTAWLQRVSDRAILCVVPQGEPFEAWRDDLEFFAGRGVLLPFPEPDNLPYDPSSPHPGITAQRLETLSRLASGEGPRTVVLATARGLIQRVPAPERLLAARIAVRAGKTHAPESLVVRLVALGYERLPEVEAMGQFARRGGILDIYPVGLDDPVRLEFDGDVVESIRRFDAGTQRSIEHLTELTVLPRFEVVLDSARASEVMERLEAAGDPGGGLFHEGMERFASHYDPARATLLDYLPAGTLVVADDPGALRARASDLIELVAEEHATQREHYPGLSPPEALFAIDACERALARPGLHWMATVFEKDDRSPDTIDVDCRPAEPVHRSIERLKGHLLDLEARGIRALVLCDNQGQRDRLAELLGPGVGRLGVGLVSAGFTLPRAGIAVLTDHEIFSRYRRRRRRLKKTGGLSLAELSALRVGDFVVHEDHGVGTYRGLQRLTLNGQETDCVEIAYAEQDRLYVPVHQLALVSRYSAEEGARPAVHRLGSVAWQKTKARAKQAIRDMAEGLVKAYAQRLALPGYAFKPDTVWQRELEASFPYEETPDQMAAIEAVKQDLEQPRPMDRLICGDVGYGKTEVAIRAAFKAVQDGKQVAVLVPTTILAQQHWLTFKERLADFPVTVEVLSRFRTPRQQKDVVARTAQGRIDILIGTHRLLSKDVRFQDLGLVVIDEEHRFGVAQKERLRQMTRTVDVLALTATPIPRTLNLSLAGARDMSVIETPPRDRLPVHTEIVETDDEVVTDAILREVDRGGQVFYVHNRVETIHHAALHVQRLVPQVRLAVGHGQMAERALERVMLEFLEKKTDVLVSTMIIESGLDIPSVNTLILDRADTLGLAQLYQLRGRVGRSSHRAYAYLLVPSRRVLTEEAEKRLRVIEEFDDLGVGFKIALKDLEIRGAGNLLGPEQHGFIIGLGFDLYMKLLEEAVAEIKGAAAEVQPEPRLLTDWSAYLPDDYVPDEHEKLALYRRLADARGAAQIEDLTLEMRDRFGALPAPAVALVELRRLRLMGRDAQVESLRVFQNVVEAMLRRPLKPTEIATLVAAVDFQVEFVTGREFGLRVRGEGLSLFHRSRELLRALAECLSVGARSST